MRIKIGVPFFCAGSLASRSAGALNLASASDGAWWMVARDHGKQISIHAAPPPASSLSIGPTQIQNPDNFNFEEDKSVVPVILTCENQGIHPPPPNAAAGPPSNATLTHIDLNNTTVVSMDLVLDVQTSAILTESVTGILRELEVRILQKLSDVVCPSTINYLQYDRRSLQTSDGGNDGMQSYKIIDLTSQRFAISKFMY